MCPSNRPPFYKTRLDRKQGESFNTPTPNPPLPEPAMRLATILTPHGPRAAVPVGDHYVDLHATDPGLPDLRQDAARRQPRRPQGRGRGGRGARTPSSTRPTPSSCCRRSRTPARSSASASTTATTPSRAASRSPPSRCCSASSRTPSSPTATRSSCPKVAQKVDYEAELVIVIGKTGKHIPNDKTAVRLRRRVHLRARRVGPRLAVQGRREAVDHRQDVRHVRPDRPGRWSPPTS